MFGPYIVIGILILVLLFVGYSIVRPKLKKYRLVLRKIEPKKRRSKPKSKKRKSVWIKVI